MCARVNNLCEVCDGPPNGRGGLCIDHDHTTGRIRGLLCSNCNTAIGLLNEDSFVIARLTAYLERYVQGR